MKFTQADVEPMALGAAVLGAGGGGEASVAEIMLAETLADGRSIEILDIEDLDTGVAVAPVALAGSPFAINEMLIAPSILDGIVDYAASSDRALSAVVTFEMAGVNALIPLVVAARQGLPCVDADFSGRGVATFDCSVFTLDGSMPDTHVLIDSMGQRVEVRTPPAFSIDRLLRPLIRELGLLVGHTTRPLTVDELRQTALKGTLTRCLRVGRIFEQLPQRSFDEATGLLAELGGRHLAEGTIIERLSHSEEHGQRASMVLDGGEEPLTRIELCNEFHVVVQDGMVLATVPDLIVLTDLETWSPLTVDQVVVGQDVRVVVLPAPERWRTPEGIRLFGPRAFGHNADFVPFEMVAG